MTSSTHFKIVCVICVVWLFSSARGLKRRTVRETPNPPYCGQCGVMNTASSRIVGGEPTRTAQYPWMAAIFFRESFTCGGSIINERHIVTAGHCITGRTTYIIPNWLFYLRTPDELTVAVGLQNLDEVKSDQIPVYKVDSVIVHPYYESVLFCGNTHNDIALIRLKRSLVFSNTVSPICLPRYDYGYSGKVSTVAGWGTTSEESITVSSEMRDVELDVLSDDTCKQKIGWIQALLHFRPVSMICAYRATKDSCRGDSGGPLMYEVRSGVMEQIGIVSYGAGCAKPESPGIYTRVSLYVSWIERTAGSYCQSPNRQ